MVLPRKSSSFLCKTFQNELICRKIAFILDYAIVCKRVCPITHSNIIGFKRHDPLSTGAFERYYCSLLGVCFFGFSHVGTNMLHRLIYITIHINIKWHQYSLLWNFTVYFMPNKTRKHHYVSCFRFNFDALKILLKIARITPTCV